MAALALGLVRFWKLGQWSLWYDEALTLADAYHGDPSVTLLGYRSIRLTVEAVGGIPDEFSLRLLPAIAGWLVILATWWCFRPVTGGRRAGLAALIVAVSSWEVYWSQNARAYTLAALAAVLGGGLVLRGLARCSPARTVAGGIVIALGVGFHLQCAVLLAALVAAPWVLKGLGRPLDDRARRAVFALLGCALVLFALSGVWVVDAALSYITKKGYFDSLQRLAHFVKATSFFVSPLLIVAALVGAFGAWRARDGPYTLIAIVIVLGVLAVAVIALRAQVTAQYVFVFMPWIAALAVWPLEAAFARDDRAIGLAWAALLVLPTATGTGLYFSVRQGERPRWREAYLHVWNERGPSDLILGMQAGVGEFYLAPGSTDLRNPRVVGSLDRYNVSNFEHWASQARPVWLVVRPAFFAEWTGPFAPYRAALQTFLREECHLERRFPVPMEGRDLDLEVYYWPGDGRR